MDGLLCKEAPIVAVYIYICFCWVSSPGFPPFNQIMSGRENWCG